MTAQIQIRSDGLKKPVRGNAGIAQKCAVSLGRLKGLPQALEHYALAGALFPHERHKSHAGLHREAKAPQRSVMLLASVEESRIRRWAKWVLLELKECVVHSLETSAKECYRAGSPDEAGA